MTKPGRVLLAVVVLAVVATLGGPLLLRQVPFFVVRQIELVGLRFMAPERVLDALALADEQNLFDSLREPLHRVERLTGVVAVRAERRLPGTLRVTIVERYPAAFVSTERGMAALDCDGQVLPYDPATTGLDLPLVERSDTLLVQTLCAVRDTDAALYQEVELARHGGGGAVILELGRDRVLLDGVPSGEELRAVTAVRRHLAATERVYDELDARFRGWVVARRARS